MDTTNSTSDAASEHKPKGRVKRFLLGGMLVLVAVAIVAHLTWRYSGSNQWQKIGERHGVTFFSMKSPGANIKKFKAVWKIRSKLSRFVMFALEDDSDIEAGFYDQRDIERHGDQLSWTKWKQRFSPYMQPREFVIKNQFSQDPNTKAVFYSVTATPDKIPPDDCCVRIARMTNTWRLEPLNNKGDIAVEWFVNMDIGGAVPYFVQNVVQPEGMRHFAPTVQRLLDREIYKNAKYDWIQEVQP